MRFISLFISALFVSALAFAQQDWSFTGKYPDTKKSEQTDDFYGVKVHDPYRWLEDDMAADTKDWVVKQNAVTQDYLSKIPFRDAIRTRLAELWNYEKYGAPFKEGAYTYFYKNDGLQNHSVLYRQKEKGKPEVFLNPNMFSKDGTTSLAGVDFTEDGSLAAYQISEGGSDWRKVIVINAKTKQKMDDTLRNVKFSGIAWKHNEGFYYSSYDKPKEGSQLSGKTQIHKLFFHKLGTPQSNDVLIFGGEATPRRYVGASVTEDQNFLIISAANTTYGNELYLQDLSKKDAPIIPVVKGFENEHDIVYAEHGRLYILTNLEAPNKRLIMTSFTDPTPATWQNLIPETEFPLSVSTCGNKFFAHYIKDAVSQVCQYNLEGLKEKVIELPGLGTVGGFSGKRKEEEAYYTFASYTSPVSIYKYNVNNFESSVFKTSKVKFLPEAFESEQVFYTSKDGTKIPMIITHLKGLARDGNNPTLLYGYGGFNISLTPSFSISNILFMEKGGVYAVANLRGGGEYGEKWHEAGTKMKKQNVFDDFIAAAQYLIDNKYTTKDLLAIAGGSNGGLLIGACMTQRPDLFKVCFPAVGVMDMLRYHKFTAGAGWASDYGTVDDGKEMFSYLYKYSPVYNAKKGTCYPATMVTTGDHDDRVVPAHSFKFAAAMQDAQNCNNPILIRIETKAGHGAGKPTSMIIDEQTDKWAFLYWNMGRYYGAMSIDEKLKRMNEWREKQKK